MKIAVTGFRGNVGKEFLKHGVTPLDCDVTNLEEVRERMNDVRPDFVINAASKSKPTWCEDKDNKEKAIAVNVRGAYYVALVAEELGIPVIALSTDHVFRGKEGPYKENGRGMYLRPVNFYGETKMAMETIMLAFKNVKIVRTSNLFWNQDPRVRWYVDSLEPVDVPVFQTRSFMHILHFAKSIFEVVENFDKMPQILNISGSETVDWFTFVKAFAKEVGRPTDIFMKKTRDEKHFVPRPQKVGLDTSLSAKLGITQYSYLDGLKELAND